MPDYPLKPVAELLAEIDELRGKAKEAEKRCQEIHDRIVELRKDLARHRAN